MTIIGVATCFFAAASRQSAAQRVGEECVSRIHAAVSLLYSEPQFSFQYAEFDDTLKRRLVGQIEPGRAHSFVELDSTNSPLSHSMTIQIGTSRWNNDGTGWISAVPVTQHQPILPKLPFDVSSENCASTHQATTNHLQFTFRLSGESQKSAPSFIYRLEVDRAGSMIQLDKYRVSRMRLASTVQLHRTATRAIAQPKVASLDELIAARKERLRRQLLKVDPTCHTNIINALERGRLASFIFEIKDESLRFWSSTDSITGRYSPPSSIQVSFKSRHTVSEDIEVLRVGDSMRRRTGAGDWQLGVDGPAPSTVRNLLSMKAIDWHGTNWPPDFYAPNLFVIGSSECSASLPGEFDVYYAVESGLEFSHRQRIYLDQSGRPTRLEAVDRYGKLMTTELRTYADVTIEPLR